MARPLPSDPNDANAAMEKAVRILNAASQTAAGLTQKLRRGGYSEPAAAEACRRLVALGYVNDAAFAQALLQRRLRQGRGSRLIGRELSHKGLDQEAVGAVIESVEPDAELASATELATRLVRRYAGEPPDKGQHKALSALARRGFDSGTARRALAAALDNAGDSAERE